MKTHWVSRARPKEALTPGLQVKDGKRVSMAERDERKESNKPEGLGVAEGEKTEVVDLGLDLREGKNKTKKGQARW